MSVQQKLSSGNWRRYSADDGGYYYHNEDTDQSVWDPPPGWTDPEAPMMPAGSVSMEPLTTEGRAASGSTATSASDRPASPSVNSNSSRNGRSTVAQSQEPTAADTRMSQQEVASMRAETGGSTPRREKTEEQPRRKQSDHSSNNNDGGGCCACACCACSCGTIILWLLLIFAIIILIVLAVVLTLPQSISCDEGDKGYFVKIVDPPLITSALPAMFCTAMNGTLWVNGSSFLVLNDHTPTVTLGNWTLNPVMTGCEDIDVRKQDAKLCTGFSAELPMDDGTNSRSPLLKIVNPKVDPHPVAKVSGTCEATDASQILLVQNPQVNSISPASVCQGVVSNLTLSGGPYLQLLLTNTSEWVKPYIYANGERISPDSIVLSGCTNITYEDFDSVQTCNTATIQLLRDLYNGQINLTVANPGGMPCLSGQTVTFYSLPPPSIDFAVPNAFCADNTPHTVELFGQFYFWNDAASTPKGSITVAGQVKQISAMKNCTIMPAFGYTVQVCQSIVVSYTPVVNGTGPVTYPAFIWDNQLPGCGAVFYPVATTVAPSFSDTQEKSPVFCPAGFSTPTNLNLAGIFPVINGVNPAVALGTYSIEPQFVNPSQCQPAGPAGAPLYVCTLLQLTVPDATVLSSQSQVPRLTISIGAGGACTVPITAWNVPFVTQSTVSAANPPTICNNANNVQVALTGQFIRYMNGGTLITIGGTPQPIVTFSGCSTDLSTAQTCTDALVNVTGNFGSPQALDIRLDISTCSNTVPGLLTANAASC